MYHRHFDIVSFHYYSQFSQLVSNSISTELQHVEADPIVLLEVTTDVPLEFVSAIPLKYSFALPLKRYPLCNTRRCPLYTTGSCTELLHKNYSKVKKSNY